MNVIPEIFLILWEDEAMSVTEKFFSVLLISHMERQASSELKSP